MELVFGVVELLERVLGEAVVFIGVGQRDGGHALMPVSTVDQFVEFGQSVFEVCLLYTSPSPRDATLSRMPSSA